MFFFSLVCDVSQVVEGQAVTDHRVFVRTIIRHSDFITAVTMDADKHTHIHMQYF